MIGDVDGVSSMTGIPLISPQRHRGHGGKPETRNQKPEQNPKAERKKL
jgi:hypothetical protein